LPGAPEPTAGADFGAGAAITAAPTVIAAKKASTTVAWVTTAGRTVFSIGESYRKWVN
jgi:hypothetical protein